jgi:hypothetical protein
MPVQNQAFRRNQVTATMTAAVMVVEGTMASGV